MSEGNKTGQDLADGAEAAIKKHSLQSQVIACTTDCEPFMVKMGRLLESKSLCEHVGCCNHRLESTTSIVFNGPRVQRATASARGFVMRYIASRQATPRLKHLIAVFPGMQDLKVIRDVATRWWSTYSMMARLLHLKKAILLHEQLDNLATMLAEMEWSILAVITPILKPFMETQRLLEGAEYATGSLAMPSIHNLREDLEYAVQDLAKALSDDDDDEAEAHIVKASEAVLLCVLALKADFNNRWVDRSDVLTLRRQQEATPRLQEGAGASNGS